MFSLNAAVAVMEASGLGENAIISILRTLKEAGKITSNAFQGACVSQRDLDKLIRQYQL